MPENCRHKQEDDFSCIREMKHVKCRYIYFLKQNFSNRKARQETTVPAPRKRKAENTMNEKVHVGFKMLPFIYYMKDYK